MSQETTRYPSYAEDLRKEPWRHVAHLTIEFTTAFHIGAGEGDDVSDAEIIRDAYGFPAIPGSSIKGVLRSLMEETKFAELDDFFGTQKNGGSLSVTWGKLHDQNNQPVTQSSMDADDEVLKDALNPTLRDHVRMNHRGTADAENNGKFDQLVVSAGHRFSFRLELASASEAAAAQLDHLVSFFSAGCVRLGGKTRRGLGECNLVALRKGIFDLTKKKDVLGYAAFRQNPLSEPEKAITENVHPSSCYFLKFSLRDFLMTGSGVDPENQADDAQLYVPWVKWRTENGSVSGSVSEVPILPGSSIKGVLAHRTAYHYNQGAGVSIDPENLPNAEEWEGMIKQHTGSANAAVKDLFGEVVAHSEDKGQAGKVFIGDLDLSFITKLADAQPHVKIDPFTGGASDSALFSERPLLRNGENTLTLKIEIRGELSDQSKAAFEAALGDLSEGRLPVGAGGAIGYGFLVGKLEAPQTQSKQEENAA